MRYTSLNTRNTIQVNRSIPLLYAAGQQ